MITRLWHALTGLAAALERFANAVHGVSQQIEQQAGLAPAEAVADSHAAAQLPSSSQAEGAALPAPSANGERSAKGVAPSRSGKRK